MKKVTEFELDLKDSSPLNSLRSIINDLLIERFLLGRTKFCGYGAYTKVNMRIFSSIITVSIAAFFIWGSASIIHNQLLSQTNHQGKATLSSNDENYSLSKNENPPTEEKIAFADIIKFLLSAVAAVGLLFWRERTTHYDKWKYLASLYNEYVVAQSNDDNSKCNEREILISSLALDLIDMNMWGHDSFKTFFKNILVKSVAHYNLKNPENKIIFDRSVKSDFTYVKIAKDKARIAIQLYQHEFLPKNDFPSEMEFKDSSVAC